MRTEGVSMTHLGLHVGADWWVHLNTYDDHSPILDISAGSVMVALQIRNQKADKAALEFARKLAESTARFAAEVERLHTTQTETESGQAA